MAEEHKPDDLRDEFQALGERFRALLTSAWESEERRKLQAELEAGMRELSAALNDLTEEARRSQAGEKIHREAEAFGERVRSGEMETKAREEIIKALKMLNAALEKISRKFDPPDES